MVKDALDWVHQLGTLCGLSGKYKEMFHQIATSDHGTFTALKPLCQTRWSVRQSAIRSVLTHTVNPNKFTELKNCFATDYTIIF